MAPNSLPDTAFRVSKVGAVAQLGERLVRNEEVSGSIPLGSTNLTAYQIGDFGGGEFSTGLHDFLRVTIWRPAESRPTRSVTQNVFFCPEEFIAERSGLSAALSEAC